MCCSHFTLTSSLESPDWYSPAPPLHVPIGNRRVFGNAQVEGAAEECKPLGPGIPLHLRWLTPEIPWSLRLGRLKEGV